MSLPSYSFGAEGVEFGRSSAYYALAGTGGGDGVTEIIAGSNITISPSNGQGAVTISASGGSGGVSSVTASGAGITATPTSGAVVVANTGVTSVTASGAGLSVSAPSGAVSFSNTGVTSLIAGAGLAVSSASGAVTVSATAPYTTGDLTVSGQLNVTGSSVLGNSQASNLTFGGLLRTGNVRGTYLSPIVLTLPSVGTNPLGGTSGLMRIPYLDTINGYQRFVANVAVSATNSSTLLVQPTGQNALRDASSYSFYATSANVRGDNTIAPFGQVLSIIAYGIPSSGGIDPVGSFMEAYYFIINPSL
jgi:hypothetical protein